jgi:hypothetical protein
LRYFGDGLLLLLLLLLTLLQVRRQSLTRFA